MPFKRDVTAPGASGGTDAGQSQDAYGNNIPQKNLKFKRILEGGIKYAVALQLM